MIRFLAFAFVLAAAPCLAQDATLARIQGPVFIRAGGSAKDIRAKGGEELLYGDTVRTGASGAAHLLIGDRGAVLVRGNASFTLRGNPRETSLRFAFGEFLIGLRRALAPGESFKVLTPAAVAAVRGTLFWGKTDKKKTTVYAGFGHEIAVTAQGRTVIVRAGETTTVPFGSAPAAATPHAIPAAYLEHFKVGESLESLDDLVVLPRR